MPINLANRLPVDEQADENREWLSKLQGNILRSHGRNHSAHLFFELGPDLCRARSIVSRLTPSVTSASEQYLDTLRFRRDKTAGNLFCTLSLSASGYKALGFSGLTAFDEGKATGLDPQACFLDGMKGHPEDLADPPADEWERGYRGRIDGMLLVAHDDPAELKPAVAAATAVIDPDRLLAIEYGEVIRNANGDPIEHFGFMDGRSQPLYLADDFILNSWGQPIRERRYKDRPLDRWTPFEPLQRVLTPDPFGTDAACLGSFLVFRKLEQNVRGFVEAEQRLARRLELNGASAERAGAMVVGRFRDGSPLSHASASGWHPTGENDFLYRDDERGWRCPFHAHIRRVNPRGSVDGDQERERRLTRRGVTYGPPAPVPGPDVDVDGLPDKGVGMLFMAYQASIRRQFAFVQKRWINSPDFPRGGVGVDALVGTAGATYQWPTAFNSHAAAPDTFGTHVRMLGGEFFFTPSLPFLRSL
jgi:deferrochelatase/peroxidase EfeB